MLGSRDVKSIASEFVRTNSMLVETYTAGFKVETSNCVDINSVLVKTQVATSNE